MTCVSPYIYDMSVTCCALDLSPASHLLRTRSITCCSPDALTSISPPVAIRCLSPLVHYIHHPRNHVVSPDISTSPQPQSKEKRRNTEKSGTTEERAKTERRGRVTQKRGITQKIEFTEKRGLRQKERYRHDDKSEALSMCPPSHHHHGHLRWCDREMEEGYAALVEVSL